MRPSGDQLGDPEQPTGVSRRTRRPSLVITYTEPGAYQVFAAVPMNAIFEPSGDHDGTKATRTGPGGGERFPAVPHESAASSSARASAPPAHIAPIATSTIIPAQLTPHCLREAFAHTAGAG